MRQMRRWKFQCEISPQLPRWHIYHHILVILCRIPCRRWVRELSNLKEVTSSAVHTAFVLPICKCSPKTLFMNVLQRERTEAERSSHLSGRRGAWLIGTSTEQRLTKNRNNGIISFNEEQTASCSLVAFLLRHWPHWQGSTLGSRSSLDSPALLKREQWM